MARSQIRSRQFAAVLVTAALFFTFDAAWIPVKARVGQILMERAWQKKLSGHEDSRPWPWADTRPVAVLRIPVLGISQLVLEGASGRNLAWGPAALTPIQSNDLVISGHRDTHFSMLGKLKEGTILELDRGKSIYRFQITGFEVINSLVNDLVLDEARNRLTLVTCWPLDALDPGGPLRLVVSANRIL